MSCASLIHTSTSLTAHSRQTFAALFGRGLDALAAWRLARRQARELEQLDDRTMADLGLRRGDIRSIVAEHTGQAEHTRLRVVLLAQRARTSA